jgi:hypothetical protein
MKLNDAIDMKGRLTLRLENRAGEIVEEIAADNAIVMSGRRLVANLFAKIEEKPISHIAVGKVVSDTLKVNPDEKKLGDEVLRKPIKPIVIDDSNTGGDNRVRVIVSMDLDFGEANGALTEAAIFNDATLNGGTMYNRVIFKPVNKTEDFKLTLVWEIIF